MKKQIKRIICSLLVPVMLVTSMPLWGLAAEGSGFADVPSSSWYAFPVQWAVDNDVTQGIGNGLFGPNDPCTRGQVVTFLWAANGRPEPQSEENPFTDVSSGDYFYKPVLWAVERGITGGTSADTFSPNAICNRAEIVTFLYAAAGKPAVKGSSSFYDVALTHWYYKAVLWAAANDVTEGTGPSTFGPMNTCVRSQVVTFLYKAYATGLILPENKPAPDIIPTTPKPAYSGASVSFTSTVSVVKGTEQPLHITVNPGNYYGNYVIMYEIGDKSIVSASWGKWGENEIDSFLNGLVGGTSTVNILLMTEDEEILTSKTVYITVVGSGHDNRGQRAYESLRNWLMKNYHNMHGDSYSYSEYQLISGSLIQFEVFYLPGRDYINMKIASARPDGNMVTYLELSPYVDKMKADFYFHSFDSPVDQAQFIGTANILKSEFNSNAEISFDEVSGDTTYEEEYLVDMQYQLLMGLIYLEYIYMDYRPEYSIVDLGFTSFHG